MLSVELEAALLRELAARYRWENLRRFGGKLVAPVIELVDSAKTLGRWRRDVRKLEISRALVAGASWLEVLSVLEHEMAHQYVEEVLGVHDETPHGPTFQRICAERGIDARAAGMPAASAVELVETERILERIRKLLALASSVNEHEAELAMRRAHELMLRHNIEAAHAHASYEIRHLGDPAKRGTRVEAEIASLLSQLFFVNVIRVPAFSIATGKPGNVYEIVGTRPNVEMAEHVYGFLLATANRLWRENRTDARIRSGRDRIAYQTGVIRGFRAKLLRERDGFKGTGLVWVGDSSCDAFYNARHPHIVRRNRRFRVDGAMSAGAEAGDKIVLHKPVESRASRGNLLRG